MARFTRRVRGVPSGLENLSSTAGGSNLQGHVFEFPTLLNPDSGFPWTLRSTISSVDIALQVRPGLTLEVPMVAFRHGCLSLYRGIH